ncbi:MAG: hypothetical protein AB7N53_03875, partial [Candidatus Binatia bacterium]
AVVLSIGASARSSATVVVAKDFTALCAEADLVFVGTVTGVESAWRDASKRSIETRVSFGDLTWLRGTGAVKVTLRFAGGEMDGVREEIAGVPRFSVGDRRVVFARDGDFLSPVVGFDQGLFRVVDGAAGPVVQDVEGNAVVGVGRAALQRGTPGDREHALPLDVFLDRVRAQLEQDGR